jgi:hypothetical protein
MFVFVEGLYTRLSLLLCSLTHHLPFFRLITMADQDQAELNDTNQPEATVSPTTKSTTKKSKNKAAATPSTTDVPDGNNSATNQNNNVKSKFEFKNLFDPFYSIGSNRRFSTKFIKTNRFS